MLINTAIITKALNIFFLSLSPENTILPYIFKNYRITPDGFPAGDEELADV